ncbi:hypothetical protein VPH35_012017 [Triticum aestivum]
MASGLRHAARRLGTTAAEAAAVERLPLSTTRIVNSTTGHNLTPDQRKDAVLRLVLIQAKKEGLYNMIAAWEAEYFAYSSLGLKNNLLLKELSQYVKPRRDDPRWYMHNPPPAMLLFLQSLNIAILANYIISSASCRRAIYFNDFFRFAGAVLIGKMVGDAINEYHAKSARSLP